MENKPTIDKNALDAGFIHLPYITKIVSTNINGETVWYANKWKNMLLKIKHFFAKPKYLKIAYKYNKPINPSYYGKINVTGEEIK